MRPEYRDDIGKGELPNIKTDFQSILQNEISNGDCFMLDVTDSEAYQEYSKYLTDAEMRAIFKHLYRGQ
jgi:hypothetical protein